jgi:NAD(P)-dependent dehydrogenase (short-subunit alcohol dehydrogenase family)
MELQMILKGKTALITGGTTGIGFASARLFLNEGATVIITGQDQSRLTTAKQVLGGDIHAIKADVKKINEIQSLAETIKAQHGVVDILFANAGIAYATPLDLISEERYDEIMNINVKGVFFTVKSIAPLMAAGGSIILNTSWLDQVGTAGLSLLSASKAAVRSLTRSLGAELITKGIRVNAISPGAIDTPIHTKTGMSPTDLQQFAEKIQQQVPMGRFGIPEEIAAAALFLASHSSSYMLGAEVVVDGGFSEL